VKGKFILNVTTFCQRWKLRELTIRLR